MHGMDKSSLQLQSEEQALLKQAEGYKGTDNIKELLMKQAEADGYADDAEAEAIVNRVLSRLRKTESGITGRTLGVANDPVKRWKSMVKRVQQLHSY